MGYSGHLELSYYITVNTDHGVLSRKGFDLYLTQAHVQPLKFACTYPTYRKHRLKWGCLMGTDMLVLSFLSCLFYRGSAFDTIKVFRGAFPPAINCLAPEPSLATTKCNLFTQGLDSRHVSSPQWELPLVLKALLFNFYVAFELS